MKTGTEHSLGFLVHDAARLLRKRFEARAADTGLSSAQWRLLFRLIRDEGVPQARLAEILEIEPISVSRLLDRMEDGGWIERRQDAADRRVRVIFATEKARGAYAAVKGIADSIYEEALAGLSGEARETLVNALEQMRANLSDDGCGSCADGELSLSTSSQLERSER